MPHNYSIYNSLSYFEILNFVWRGIGGMAPVSNGLNTWNNRECLPVIACAACAGAAVFVYRLAGIIAYRILQRDSGGSGVGSSAFS